MKTGADNSGNEKISNVFKNIRNLFGDNDKNKDTSQKIQDIANTVEQGTKIVENLRSKTGEGGSISKIVDSVKGIAEEEAKGDRNFGDYVSGGAKMAGTAGSIGTAVGTVVPGIGNAIGGAVGSIVGAVGGVAKNLIQDLGGPGVYGISKKVEKELSERLKKAGIQLPPSVQKEGYIATGYNHDEEEKAKEISQIIQVAKEFGDPAANFFTKNLRKTDKRDPNQPIQKGEPPQWVKEYMDVRSKIELSIERIQKALEKISEKPEGGKRRAKDAYDKLVRLHKKYPHPEHKKAADKLLKKVEEAYKTQTSKMFGMTPDAQSKYLYIGGASVVLIAVIVTIIILMRTQD